MHVYVYRLCAGVNRGQKWDWNQELQVIVGYHAGAGNQTWVFCKSNKLS